MLEPLVLEATPLPVPTRREVAARLSVAMRSAARHLIDARRAGRLDELAVAGAIRRTFDDLGGTFTKFGQLIASSPSIFTRMGVPSGSGSSRESATGSQ